MNESVIKIMVLSHPNKAMMHPRFVLKLAVVAKEDNAFNIQHDRLPNYM
jgi:hypothetical protein